MIQELPHKVQISLALLVIAVAIALGAATAYYNQYMVENLLETKLETQKQLLLNLAELTDRNAVDSVSGSLVQDCSQRKEYESLLGRLDTLQQKELLKLQSLIENCGSYYPELKAIMVSRMEQEFNDYTELIDVLKVLNSDNLELYNFSSWEELIELEKKRSDLFKEQVYIQTEIIQLLIQGNSTQSVIVQNQVKEAQRISVLLVSNDNRIDELRSSLIE